MPPDPPARAEPRAEAAIAHRRRFNPLRRAGESRSLFGEILDWMFAPLLLLWPMSVSLTYLVAQSIASSPFDRALVNRAEALSVHVRFVRGQAGFDTAPATAELLSAGASTIAYLIVDAGGQPLAGDHDLPRPAAATGAEPQAPGEFRLRTDTLRGQEVRVAYGWVQEGGLAAATTAQAPSLALVELAEPLTERTALANEIIRGVILPQFIVLPVALLLVWFGLTRGLAPVARLQARIRARRPEDLSPIDAAGAPEELAPLLAAFNELLARLTHNLEAQKRFIADAAHQMKTPLAGLRTQAELAQRESDPEQLKRGLRQITSSTVRATRLIDQLLSLARAEHSANEPAAFAVLDLDALARGVVQQWVPQAMAGGIDLGYEGAEAPCPIIGAPTLLREMMNNLVDNALRYTPAGGAVTVRVRPSADHATVLLDVEDSGPGIPEAERMLVFDRFYRVLGSSKDGSGLGLAIVREIVAQHDALLRLSANPRATEPAAPGTLFSIEFTHTPTAAPTYTLP